MTMYISLIRGVNVGGKKKIRMQDIAAAYTALHFTRVRTCLQSGNVLFDAPETDAERLAALLEERIAAMAGFPVRVIIRTAAELRHTVENNPFLYPDGPDPTTLHVTFLSGIPASDRVEAVRTITDPSDRFILAGKEVYLLCPHGYGRTKFSNTFFERKLDVAATTRNWNTVMLLSEAAQE
ncbi:MAG: DUF1697 domain-containing protein [Methanomicrobiales archaeon]|nr:DUF1697 domain-containing protein [Methanomicrobiales archaeon]